MGAPHEMATPRKKKKTKPISEEEKMDIVEPCISLPELCPPVIEEMKVENENPKTESNKMDIDEEVPELKNDLPIKSEIKSGNASVTLKPNQLKENKQKVDSKDVASPLPNSETGSQNTK